MQIDYHGVGRESSPPITKLSRRTSSDVLVLGDMLIELQRGALHGLRVGRSSFGQAARL